MLTEHKSDPNFLTLTPQTRRRRKLRRQKTAIPARLSNSDRQLSGSSIFQILMNTKSRVQGIGYNMKSFLFDDARPIVNSEFSRLWLSGEQISDSESFYGKWSRMHRMTYRRYWPEPLANSKTLILYDSDTGWGCTVRSSQMLLSNVLSRLDFCGKRLCACFLDRLTSVFSVHNFVNSQSEKRAGEWFGPSSATNAISKILSAHESVWLNLGVYVSFDGRLNTTVISEQSLQRMGSSFGSSIDTPPAVATTCRKSNAGSSWEICNENMCPSSSLSGSSSLAPSPREGFVDLCASQVSNSEFFLVEEDDGVSVASSLDGRLVCNASGESWSRPVLVLVAVRLSPETELSSTQTAALLSYMTLPSFVGIIGGPDRRCHFIIGLLEERKQQEGEPHLHHGSVEYELLSIDPHIVQEAVVEGTLTGQSNPFDNSPHPTRLSPSILCPSLSIGFLIKSQDDLEVLSHALTTCMAGGFIEMISSEEPSRCQYSSTQLVEDNDSLVVG